MAMTQLDKNWGLDDGEFPVTWCVHWRPQVSITAYQHILFIRKWTSCPSGYPTYS